MLENYGGENVIIEAGKDADIVDNYGDNTTINAGDGNNIIYHSSDSNVVINNGTKSFINLGADNDYVYNDSLGNDATISGLDGNDTLENRVANVSINGGSGNNKIVNDGSAVTMISGDDSKRGELVHSQYFWNRSFYSHLDVERHNGDLWYLQ